MLKLISTIFAVATITALIPCKSFGQSAATYQLLAAGTEGQEKGYCSIGTVTIKDNKTISITTKNPTDTRTAPTYTGTISTTTFYARSGSRSVQGTIGYAGTKYAYGNYTAYYVSNGIRRKVGAGKYSMSRK